MTKLDPAAADNVHYATDPRIRHLAEATWRMRTGGSRTDWLMLGKDNPEALIREAREWVRAAVASGLLPAPSSSPEWKTAAWDAANADQQTPRSFAEAMANPIDRAIFADSLDIALGGGCGLCDTERDHLCVGCGKCRCFDHDACTRPA